MAVPRLTDRRLIALLAGVAVLLRVPFLAHPLGLDEGGFAYVAANWGEGSGSLYGDQWVDRPPLLIALFSVGLFLAGELGIRLLGCVASAATVAACAAAAGRLGGRDSALWAGSIAAVLGTSTAFQGHHVNGEVLAIAFVAIALWLVVLGLQEPARALAAGAGAGVAAACALLVKQSFVDAFVASAVLLAAVAGYATRHGGGDASLRQLRGAAARIARGLLAGTVVAIALAVAWAQLRGPGAAALIEAMYGFRMEARDAIAAFPNAPERRRIMFLAAALITGAAPLLAATVATLVRRVGMQGSGDPGSTIIAWSAALALLALLTWNVFAVTHGGNWWRHYFLQLVPALAIGVGMVIGHRSDPARRFGPFGVRAWSAIAMSTAAIAWVGSLAWTWEHGAHRDHEAVGRWVAAAAEPGDTAFVAWGHANVLWYSGLRTPYDTVWSLPMRVRDTEGKRLRELLAGEDAPTWIVRWGGFAAWDLDDGGRVSDLVRSRYDKVAAPCGHAVFRLLQPGGPSDVPALPPEPATAACGNGGGIRLLGVRTW